MPVDPELRLRYEHIVGGLQMFTRPEDAHEWLAASVTDGRLTLIEAQKLITGVPRDPDAFDAWRAAALAGTLEAGRREGLEPGLHASRRNWGAPSTSAYCRSQVAGAGATRRRALAKFRADPGGGASVLATGGSHAQPEVIAREASNSRHEDPSRPRVEYGRVLEEEHADQQHQCEGDYAWYELEELAPDRPISK